MDDMLGVIQTAGGAILPWKDARAAMIEADEALYNWVNANVARIPQAYYNMFTMKYKEQSGQDLKIDLLTPNDVN